MLAPVSVQLKLPTIQLQLTTLAICCDATNSGKTPGLTLCFASDCATLLRARARKSALTIPTLLLAVSSPISRTHFQKPSLRNFRAMRLMCRSSRLCSSFSYSPPKRFHRRHNAMCRRVSSWSSLFQKRPHLLRRSFARTRHHGTRMHCTTSPYHLPKCCCVSRVAAPVRAMEAGHAINMTPLWCSPFLCTFPQECGGS